MNDKKTYLWFDLGYTLLRLKREGSFQHILENIVALGKELHHIHWWEVSTPVFTPYVLVKDVGITKATK